MKKQVSLLLTIALLLVSLVSSVAFADSNEEILNNLVGIWCYEKPPRGEEISDIPEGKNKEEEVYIIGQDQLSQKFVVSYSLLARSSNYCNLFTSQYNLSKDPFEENTYYFNDGDKMLKAVLDGDNLTVYSTDYYAEKKVFLRVGK